MARLRGGPFGAAQQQRSDGRTIEMRRHRLPDGGLVTVLADITDRALADETVRNAQAMAATAKAEKSRFATTIGEEIQATLDALRNALRQLGDSVLAPPQRSLLTTARRAGDTLSDLAGDIRDLPEIDAGTLTLRPSLFELRSVLDGCVERVADQAARHGLSLHVSVADGTPETLLTDADRLRQVLVNLAASAMKYTRTGALWLIAEKGRNAQEAIRLTLWNEGPAIAAEAREALFPSSVATGQLDSDHPVVASLGLSICRQLIRLMGGRIGCDPCRSDAGRDGNAFWITLPAAALPYRAGDDAVADPVSAAPLESIVPPAGLPARRPPRTRVLLTEDVVANQRVVAALLRQQGHCVDVASDGAAAIEALRTTPYDLVLMDIVMPGMNGQEATRIVRGLPEPACSTPIVALTANASPEDEADCDAAGMNGLLAKPASPAGLLNVLRLYVWATPGGTELARRPVTLEAQETSVPPVLSADRINELRANLPPATFAQLVEACLLDLDRRLPALRRAIVTGAPAAITAHAHAMVGMAASYGMIALEDRLRLVMNAARDGDLGPLGPGIVADLERDFEQAARSLRQMLRTEMA
jgi:signal transduction histidine kinase/CheY-like chemotaxis protein